MNAATMTASQANFDNATQIYDYWPGIQYQVLTTPNRITNIALRPGEELTKNPLSLGESANWVVAKNQIGAGKAIQWNIIIKPKLSARDTNAIIYTRDRTYILELIVVPPDNIDPVPAKNAPKTTPIYNNVIAWNYPDAETDALSQLGETTEQKAVDHSSTINPADLDFGYRIDVKGPRPSWLPTAVYTDQKRTWITFPYDMATATDTPILFLLNNANDPTPKTYTPQKDRYIVPGIIRSAQLRTDKESATIVTITRTGN
jgi:type IV secretion system protein VirB9